MPDKEQKIRVGTRGSPLALAQTREVCEALARHWPGLETEKRVIKTSGDWKPAQGETRLSEEQGGKGLFAKEIETALLEGAIDIAVHSMKDMDSALPEGLVIDHMRPRQDARDALILCEELRTSVRSLEDLPRGASIGTASVRRAAFLLSKRPDLEIAPLRGNVHTRIEKIRARQADASFLALAGLIRLNLDFEADVILSPEEMLPAAGQGAVGIEMRTGESRIAELLEPLSCAETLLCITAERAALQALDGSCRTPIGAYAVFASPSQMRLRVQISDTKGTEIKIKDETDRIENRERAESFGKRIGKILKKQASTEVSL